MLSDETHYQGSYRFKEAGSKTRDMYFFMKKCRNWFEIQQPWKEFKHIIFMYDFMYDSYMYINVCVCKIIVITARLPLLPPHIMLPASNWFSSVGMRTIFKIYCLIPTKWHSGEGKTMETVKDQRLPGVGSGG